MIEIKCGWGANALKNRMQPLTWTLTHPFPRRGAQLKRMKDAPPRLTLARRVNGRGQRTTQKERVWESMHFRC